MTGKGNRFGILPTDIAGASAPSPRRMREPGPMGVAVRESAASALEASESLIEQRRQNAVDAKELKAAREEGRVLVSLPLDQILTDALPRDRMDLEAVASGDEMDELKASLRERGQREAVEVFLAQDGSYQLKAGWRRLTALRQLYAETSDPRYAVILSRITTLGSDRADLYIDMVEENVIRQDLSFAEMAQIAVQLAHDPQAGVAGTDEAVARLFRSLHKVKRAYIRAFVTVLNVLGDVLPYPKALARDLGVDVARRLSSVDAGELAELRSALVGCETPEAQALVLKRFLTEAAVVERGAAKAVQTARQKFEFHVGDSKVTARKGEFRIKAGVDFTMLDRDVLERAVKAFHAALNSKS